ncbi:hypothetical protein, conserved [Leishmania tarentolae]|uniref:Uncharacterized protein n=1 Tax=Leishmania tarentolae TaxID=5689 RepID=A0A640KMV0_LEITA|nr:hypothetical protein, conserved [Leishmania tarentolae]
MPSVDIDVTSVPDIIEAQLTLSYSRLTDVIRVLVEQGNGNADDIDEIRDRLGKLAQENSALRAEIQTLKQTKGPDDEVKNALEDLKSTVAQLSEKVEASTEQMEASDASHKTYSAEAEKRSSEQQEAMMATFNRHSEALGKRVEATEKSLHELQAFVDLWGAGPEQVLEMGRRTDKQELEHSLVDRTQYLLSLHSFAKIQEEMEVLRALVQRQAADALAAKTSEAARTSRTASYVAAMAAPTETAHHSGEIETLTRTMRFLEQDVEALQKQRLPPLESAVHELQAFTDSEKRISSTEKDLKHLNDHLTHLEDRLNTLLGQTGESKEDAVDGSHPGLVDLARRVSLLEDTVDGCSRGQRSTSTSYGPAAGGEAVSADGTAPAAPARSLSRNRGSILATGLPPSGRLGGSVLPAVAKEAPRGSSPVAEGGSAPQPLQRVSSTANSFHSKELDQPAVEALRRQEASQPAVATDRRRFSVAVEQDDGLRRRVAQLEENTAILEINKADRKEIRELEEALRIALENAHRLQQQIPLQQNQQPLPPLQNAVPSNFASNAPSLVPQRPVSASGRQAVPDYAVNQQRGDGFSRPTTSMAGLGRPMFVGSSSSVYLRDGGNLTNATVSPTHLYRQ